MPCLKTTSQFQLYSGEMLPNYTKEFCLLGLFLTPNSLLYLLALPSKSAPLLIQCDSGTSRFAFGTRSGFGPEHYHFIYCVVFCKLFHLCLKLINLTFLSEICLKYDCEVLKQLLAINLVDCGVALFG